MVTEVWKDIIGWEWFYKVSNFWRFINIKNNLIKSPSIKSNWYICVRFSKKWISKSYNWHRLVAQAFIPNPENKPCINHKNWVKSDNRVENLEWCTHSYNQKYAYKLWRFKRWQKLKIYDTSQEKIISLITLQKLYGRNKRNRNIYFNPWKHI